LYKHLGGRGLGSSPAQANRRILDRLDGVIEPVDPSDWNSVARRMMLPAILLKIHDEEGRTDRPELSRIAEHFESIREAGRLIFDQDMVEALHLGLWARERRHFAVLTGLSGTGKTQLALEYAKALTGEDGESKARICTIAVQPGWYDPTPLLGYVNPLGESRYNATEFLRFLIRATENPSQPHVCVLDEMNLSHPEQYLAPILSAMELEHGEIELHSGDADEYGIASSIHYPDNLVLIGTVNMDETTMGISDKVLDRAFTLEFWDVDVDRWPGWERTSLVDQDREATMAVLTRLMEALSPARLHFGWRVIEEVVRFMEQRQAQSAALSVNDALDRVLYAKVLPKLRGDDSPRFRNALADCQTALKERNLTRSTRKVDELIEDVDQTGSFRFWR
jgi:5-methylcytosine-specific restriction protein B